MKFLFFIPELWDLNYYSVLFQHKYCINVPIQCLWCSCWRNLDFSYKSYGKESLYKYCMNVDDGRILAQLFILYSSVDFVSPVIDRKGSEE